MVGGCDIIVMNIISFIEIKEPPFLEGYCHFNFKEKFCASYTIASRIGEPFEAFFWGPRYLILHSRFTIPRSEPFSVNLLQQKVPSCSWCCMFFKQKWRNHVEVGVVWRLDGSAVSLLRIPVHIGIVQVLVRNVQVDAVFGHPTLRQVEKCRCRCRCVSFEGCYLNIAWDGFLLSALIVTQSFKVLTSVST